ncbi:MAG: SGNH/GDSL hydrolase family protein, partial [Bermanella sp.]
LDAENRESVKSGTFRSEPIIKSTLDVSSGIGCKLRFSFVGDAFDMIFTTQGTDEWKILVDGVEVAHHLPSGEFSWSNELAITGLTFGKHVVDIYNLNDAKNIRIEAFRFYKKLTFTNNGLIGTNTKQWLPEGSLLAAAVPVSATHLFIQLGTNDRAIAAESLLPISPVRVGINLRLIVDWLRINRPDTKVILMAPPKALGTADQYGDPAKYFASSDDIAREVANLADDMGLAFISNYDPTCILDLNGEVFLADNLHPNDYGHSKIFEHIVASIEGERVSV